MSIFDLPLHHLDGTPSTLGEHHCRVTLVVNVASQCGLTPQYSGLEALHSRLFDRGFTVVGIPCNQFGAQEPGSSEEIATFCSTTYGVSFPMFEKLEVNGEGRHPLYQRLVQVPDVDGYVGDIRWNFEKFLVVSEDNVMRFAPLVTPEDEALVSAIEKALA